METWEGEGVMMKWDETREERDGASDIMDERGSGLLGAG